MYSAAPPLMLSFRCVGWGGGLRKAKRGRAWLGCARGECFRPARADVGVGLRVGRGSRLGDPPPFRHSPAAGRARTVVASSADRVPPPLMVPVHERPCQESGPASSCTLTSRATAAIYATLPLHPALPDRIRVVLHPPLLKRRIEPQHCKASHPNKSVPILLPGQPTDLSSGVTYSA